ncbi:MAG: glycosyltransferase [Chthoniobacterales bacterium]
MKICDLTQFYSPYSGGVKRYLHEKSRFIQRQRPGDKHIIVIPGDKMEEREVDGATIYSIESPLISRTSRYRALTRLHLVEEILERERPDIIESGDPYQLAWKAAASSRALGIPAVGFYHSHFPEAYIRSVAKYFGSIAIAIAEDISRKYVCHLYNHFERTLVPSPALAALLTDWGVENVECTDLGVDGEVFRPDVDDAAETRKRLNLPADRQILLYVGRLAPEKNVKMLFAAFEQLNEKSPNQYHLFAIGDGMLRSHLLRLKEETGAVTWLPYCESRAELAKIYRAADVFVHPGVQETFGLVTLESQACGTPVIGIRGSYMDRIIFTHQEDWALENTPEALVEAITRICKDDLVELGKRASSTVRTRYSWDVVFTRLFSIYENVIAHYNR